MPSRRSQKVAEAIREVVGMAILVELNDPRVRDVTVTYVEVSGDLRQAKVHVSVMGDEVKQELSLKGLRSSAGYLQSLCAKRIDTRYTPRIEFILDQGVKKSIEIARILSEVLPAPEADDRCDAAGPSTDSVEESSPADDAAAADESAPEDPGPTGSDSLPA